MRLSQGLRPAALALLLVAATACGPAGSSAPAASGTAASPTASTAGTPIDLVATSVPLHPISIGVPSGWIVLDEDRLVELIDRLRRIEPALAEAYEMSSHDDLRAVDMDALPDGFSSLQSSYTCDSTSDAAERLEQLRANIDGALLAAAVVDLPAGQAAMVSFVRTVGSIAMTTTVYAMAAPTTDCDGTLTVFIAESVPKPGLAEAIARSITIGSGRGTVTLRTSGAIELASTSLPVVCQLGGEAGDMLRMSSGTDVEGMTIGLDVDTTGQPVFFQFATGELMYASGKGFDASTTFAPEPGATREMGAATFADITPPDDPDHPLSGHVTWACTA